MILFLDDDLKRHQKARQRFGNDAIYVFNYKEAVAVLASNAPFDVAHLDHDLIEQTAAVEKTGYDVAAYITAMPPERRPGEIIIHSHNEIGSMRMFLLLREAGCRVSIEPWCA